MSASKEQLRGKTRRKMLLIYLKQGVATLKHSGKARIKIAVFLTFAGIIYLLGFQIFKPTGMLVEMFNTLYKCAFYTLFIFGGCVCLFSFGAPSGYLEYADNLQRIGFCNSAGESPILLSAKNVPSDEDMKELTFDSCGIPLSEWENDKEALSSGLNLHIIAIDQVNNNRQIRLQVIPADHQIPTQIRWKSEYLSSGDFDIVLGESIIGKVKVDLNTLPHMLIGGSTGSGKTILLRSVLLQCIAKNAEVIIADFKGVDFHRVWKEHCEIITEAGPFSERLARVLDELSCRKRLFAEHDVADIREYNSKGARLNRIVIACDEVSELLDKTGASKELKEQIAKIESALSTIARQGRAFGIHLVLATQRPDANILSGQIKNNIDCRICGRADNVLSQIVLDNTDAADLIPKNATGRFLKNDGTIFQGYYVDDNMIAELNCCAAPGTQL